MLFEFFHAAYGYIAQQSVRSEVDDGYLLLYSEWSELRLFQDLYVAGSFVDYVFTQLILVLQLQSAWHLWFRQHHEHAQWLHPWWLQ